VGSSSSSWQRKYEATGGISLCLRRERREEMVSVERTLMPCSLRTSPTLKRVNQSEISVKNGERDPRYGKTSSQFDVFSVGVIFRNGLSC